MAGFQSYRKYPLNTQVYTFKEIKVIDFELMEHFEIVLVSETTYNLGDFWAVGFIG